LDQGVEDLVFWDHSVQLYFVFTFGGYQQIGPCEDANDKMKKHDNPKVIQSATWQSA
jgi:hypothetical protein